MCSLHRYWSYEMRCWRFRLRHFFDVEKMWDIFCHFSMWHYYWTWKWRRSISTVSSNKKGVILLSLLLKVKVKKSTQRWFMVDVDKEGIAGQWLCGSVGRAVASDTRGPRFESSHRQKFILNICFLSTVYWKDENKKKEAGIGPFLKKRRNCLYMRNTILGHVGGISVSFFASWTQRPDPINCLYLHYANHF